MVLVEGNAKLMKHSIAIAVALLSTGAVPAFSQTCTPPVGSSLQVVGVVSNDVLNVRDGMGTSYPIIDTLLPDSISATFVGGVQFTNQNCKELCLSSNYGSDNYFAFEASCVERGRVWYEIVTNNRKLGWASAKHLDIIPDESATRSAGSEINDEDPTSREQDRGSMALDSQQLESLRVRFSVSCIEVSTPSTLFRNLNVFSDISRKTEYCECISKSIFVDGFTQNNLDRIKGITDDYAAMSILTNGSNVDEIMSRCEGSKETISTDRINYIKDVLANYHIALMCAENGMLGGFTPSYVQKNFERSSRNDLSEYEMNILSEYEVTTIRSLGANQDICGALQFGFSLDPNFTDTFFDQH